MLLPSRSIRKQEKGKHGKMKENNVKIEAKFITRKVRYLQMSLLYLAFKSVINTATLAAINLNDLLSSLAFFSPL
ncbi:hypothetical protein GHT06_013067 [Daphnia sinensis]|uniref:Transmembrane protein n=1 Tax=Daphnia sinensis TaxID=1820382 RepID=A0AAD5KZG3_9CRUS|nr:hypothetical protein GHT06_013067 [Daphnia sinensis]